MRKKVAQAGRQAFHSRRMRREGERRKERKDLLLERESQREIEERGEKEKTTERARESKAQSFQTPDGFPPCLRY